tara:strand:- start:162 stop:656 length:495 start_codon:yes stop_codon:yes gene_type:complete
MNKSIFSMNSLSKYSELFQIVGVIGLIASLIFVGLEMRQSHKIALSDQHLARTQVWVGVYNTATSNSIAHQYDQNHYSNFDVHSHNSFHAMWNIHEADYLRYRLGLMTDDAWQARLNYINIIKKNSASIDCMIRDRVWTDKRLVLDSEFVKLVEEIPFEECKKL